METGDLFAAHASSIYNRPMLGKGQKCGCFFCLKIYDASEITEWIREGSGTALCPYCGIDSVISDSEDRPVTPEFLAEMHEVFFDGC